METKKPEEKIYTQSDMDNEVSNVRIEERYIANQLMGDLGIPVDRRIGPNGQPIYDQAARIVMSTLLKGKPKEEVPSEPIPPQD